jgi:hypothetical protein
VITTAGATFRVIRSERAPFTLHKNGTDSAKSSEPDNVLL